MNDDILGDRRRGLEEEFFRKHNDGLVTEMRASRERGDIRQSLAAACGFADPVLLDKLLDLGLTAETLLPLTLVPLVEVAWADGKLDDKERQAVLQGAAACGVQPEHAGYALLEEWLTESPGPRLMAAWEAYVRGVCAESGAEVCGSLKEDVLGRARSVARAAGGFGGLGSRISANEEEVLRRLESAFASAPA